MEVSPLHYQVNVQPCALDVEILLETFAFDGGALTAGAVGGRYSPSKGSAPSETPFSALSFATISRTSASNSFAL